MKKIVLASILAASMATVAFANVGGVGGVGGVGNGNGGGSSATQKYGMGKQVATNNLVNVAITGNTGMQTCNTSGQKPGTGTSACVYVLNCAAPTDKGDTWTCEAASGDVTVTQVTFSGSKTSRNGNGDHTVTYSQTCTNSGSEGSADFSCSSTHQGSSTRNS